MGWLLGVVVVDVALALYVIQESVGLPGLQNWVEPSRIVSLIFDARFIAAARKSIGSRRPELTVANRSLLRAVPSAVQAHLIPVSMLMSNRVVWPAEIVTVCGRSLLLSMPRRCSSTRYVPGDRATRYVQSDARSKRVASAPVWASNTTRPRAVQAAGDGVGAGTPTRWTGCSGPMLARPSR
jgi:hypothetical protein